MIVGWLMLGSHLRPWRQLCLWSIDTPRLGTLGGRFSLRHT
jgi:hypothetical protein